MGVGFLQPTVTFIMSFCDTAITCNSSIPKCLCTQRCVGTLHRFVQQKCRPASLWFMLHFVPYTLNFLFWLNWCLWNLLELLERAGFFNNCILCTCEMCGCIETIWKDMLLHPTAEGCPQGNKANQRHQQPSKKSKRNQSLSTPRRLWVLKTEEDLPWGAWCVHLACLCTLERTGVKI